MNYLFAYLIATSIVSFLLFGIDKLKAKKHHWRIPESVLLISAAIGGSIGALLGMYLFRHKTQHKKFTIGVPLIIVLQIIIGFVILCK